MSASRDMHTNPGMRESGMLCQKEARSTLKEGGCTTISCDEEVFYMTTVYSADI